MKIIEGISYYPIALYYLAKIDKRISADKYKPASYDQWVMLKELDPTKFLFDYNDYIKLKQKEYDEEVEFLKSQDLKLEFFMITIDIRQPESIEKAKSKILEIESGEFFKNWVNKEVVNDIKYE